jgi:uncharacterized membrane protein
MGSTNFIFTSVFAVVYAGLSVTKTFDVGLLITVNFAIALVILVLVVRPWTIPDLRKGAVLEEEHH